MIDTAETVAKRYGVSREYQDEYALQSQMRDCRRPTGGQAVDDEIVPMKTVKLVTNKETGETSEQEVMIEQDECNRPTTNAEGLASLAPVRGEEHFITVGNASQLRTARPPPF